MSRKYAKKTDETSPEGTFELEACTATGLPRYRAHLFHQLSPIGSISIRNARILMPGSGIVAIPGLTKCTSEICADASCILIMIKQSNSIICNGLIKYSVSVSASSEKQILALY